MDFVEKIFGIAPDAGSGSLEAALVMVVAAVVVAAIVVRKRAVGPEMGLRQRRWYSDE